MSKNKTFYVEGTLKCPEDPACNRFVLLEGQWHCFHHNKPTHPDVTEEEMKEIAPNLYEIQKAYGIWDEHVPSKILEKPKRKKKTLEDYF